MSNTYFIHSAPQPTFSFGYVENADNGRAVFQRYAFIFCPYRKGSLPATIPYCIKRAAAPVTKGAAMEVPVRIVYPPPGAVLRILTAGAQRSGFVYILFENPCPENGANVSRELSYPLTLITLEAVDGMVNVISEDGERKPVAEFVASFDGSQNCSLLSVVFWEEDGVMRSVHIPGVIKEVSDLKSRKYCWNV